MTATVSIQVPLVFATMMLVSRLTRPTAPPDASRIFGRMHVRERLGMGVKRLPPEWTRPLIAIGVARRHPRIVDQVLITHSESGITDKHVALLREIDGLVRR